MRTRSLKRARQEREYAKKRALHMEQYPWCAACSDEHQAVLADDLHHMIGRDGWRLTDERFFLSLCRAHHNQVTVNPRWAMEMGYSLSRLAS